MTIDKRPLTPSGTVRSDEGARFNRLAATWWNRNGPMRPLHVVNELRLSHVLEQIAERFGRPVGALQGLRIAAVGCGAALVCEPLAARGASEVVEHVDDVPAFVRDAVAHLAPGGLLLASTINRTLSSYLAAIVGAEMVFRVLPRGTHRWAQSVRPEELEQAAAACGLSPGERRGMTYLPAIHRAWWTRGLAVNYFASHSKPRDTLAQSRVTDSLPRR